MPIKIDKDNKSKRVEILRVGNFERRFEEDLKITLTDLQKLKQNFDADCRRQKLNGKPVVPFNFSHNIWDEAAGWITELNIDKDEQNYDALFAQVDWTPKGAQKIKDNEFKFVSSEFIYNFKDPETGKIYDVLLGGAALTNIPFIRDMEAVNLSESTSGQRTCVSLKLSGASDSNLHLGENMPDLIKKFKAMPPEEKEKFLAECGLDKKDVKLSEKLEQAEKDLRLSETENKKLKEKFAGSEDLADKLKLSESRIDDLKKEVFKLTEEREKDKKEGQFNAMLSEGKVCPAQKEAFMKGDMADFAAKAQPVKLNESGKNSQSEEEGGDVQSKIDKLAEEKMKLDESLSYGDAVRAVLSEDSKLSKAYEEA